MRFCRQHWQSVSTRPRNRDDAVCRQHSQYLQGHRSGTMRFCRQHSQYLQGHRSGTMRFCRQHISVSTRPRIRDDAGGFAVNTVSIYKATEHGRCGFAVNTVSIYKATEQGRCGFAANTVSIYKATEQGRCRRFCRQHSQYLQGHGSGSMWNATFRLVLPTSVATTSRDVTRPATSRAAATRERSRTRQTKPRRPSVLSLKTLSVTGTFISSSAGQVWRQAGEKMLASLTL